MAGHRRTEIGGGGFRSIEDAGDFEKATKGLEVGNSIMPPVQRGDGSFFTALKL